MLRFVHTRHIRVPAISESNRLNAEPAQMCGEPEIATLVARLLDCSVRTRHTLA